MRTLMKISIPVEPGNKALKDGSLSRIIQSTLETLHPEAAYFTTEGGRRTAFLVIDLQDSSSIPSIAEPIFQGLDAAIDFVPVMNVQDLQTGLSKLSKG